MDKYNDTIEYLYNSTPQFQVIGAAAYKPGLDTARTLDNAFNTPHHNYPTIHIAGTNGKGSTAHTIAAILQCAGYRTGLYTSPHLVDFRERIRVNGEMISKDGVIDFIERYKKMNLTCSPSFFELTTIMAFDWFSKQKVDVAVIETGLGGRLDTTNIITPVLSIITNISLDHVKQLGDTVQSIALEKAGIIKPGIPVVIGEADSVTEPIFREKALANNSPIHFACKHPMMQRATVTDDYNLYTATPYGNIKGKLTGECQIKNTATILEAISLLKNDFTLADDDIREGFEKVTELTNLSGRWEKVSSAPITICDTGHNTGGWQYTSHRLSTLPRPLVMVIGFVNDKDVDHILEYMPTDAIYIFTQASIPRAMPAGDVASKAAAFGLKGEVIEDVKKAVDTAISTAGSTGSIFIGGSTFVVADFIGSR